MENRTKSPEFELMQELEKEERNYKNAIEQKKNYVALKKIKAKIKAIKEALHIV
jgi:hypothetical protein